MAMAPDTTPRITVYSWLMISTLAFVWGGTFMLTEIALRGITPFWLAAARIMFAALVMIAVWGLRGFALFQAPLTNQQRVALVSIGAVSSAVPFALLAWGQQHVTSGFAGVSMASTALIMLVLAHFFVKGEQMTLRRAIGFAIGFCGVVVLIGGQAFDSTGGSLEPFRRAACIGAACCYAISSILMRRLPAVDPIGLATVLLIIASAITVPMALIIEGLPPLPDNQTLMVLAFLGLIPTAAANILRVLVVRSAGPVFMSLVNYQLPVWSVLLGAWILSEPMPTSLIYAMVLILVGVGISQYGALRRLMGRA